MFEMILQHRNRFGRKFLVLDTEKNEHTMFELPQPHIFDIFQLQIIRQSCASKFDCQMSFILNRLIFFQKSSALK